MRIQSSKIFVCVAVSILLLFALLQFHFARPVVTFSFVFIFGSALYLLMAWLLPAAELSPASVLLLIAVSLGVRLSFVALDPIGSEDAYRYLWDGKVQANGINPYLYTAIDPRLGALHSPLLPAAMNHADLKTIYFPLSQWIFYLCYRLSGENLWSYKLLYAAAEAATFLGLSLILARLRLDQKFILLYALCPLPILEIAIDGHLDAVGLPLFVFALSAFLAERRLLSYVLLGLSLSIKPVGLIAVPALFFFAKGWRAKASALIVPPAVLGIQFLPYLATSNPFETLFTFTKNWSFNGPVFESIYVWTDNNQTARVYCAILLVLLIGAIILKRREFFPTVYYSLLCLMLLSPVVHPWYVCWLGVLLPVVRRWSGIALVASVSLTSFTVLYYRLSGIWNQYPAALIAEYIFVLVLVVLELRSYFAGEKAALPA